MKVEEYLCNDYFPCYNQRFEDGRKSQKMLKRGTWVFHKSGVWEFAIPMSIDPLFTWKGWGIQSDGRGWWTIGCDYEEPMSAHLYTMIVGIIVNPSCQLHSITMQNTSTRHNCMYNHCGTKPETTFESWFDIISPGDQSNDALFNEPIEAWPRNSKGSHEYRTEYVFDVDHAPNRGIGLRQTKGPRLRTHFPPGTVK